MADPIYHIAAMLEQSVAGLALEQHPNGVFVDATFGGGGHSREIMRHLGKKGRLLSFDQDIEALHNAKDLCNDRRWQFVYSNFRYLKNFAKYYDINHIDGLIADLGVSFHHFDSAGRGFSFRLSGPLDMRMNTKQKLTAADIVNTYSEERLADILYLYGEMPNARQLARQICKQRQQKAITTTDELTALATPLIGRDKEKKDLARLFQALRIEVNDEMGALKDLLHSTLQLLSKGGRVVFLTYHSLEDRLVKNFFKTGNIEGTIEKDFFGNIITPFSLINKKVIIASEEEVRQNPRARSAKLRIAEKK